MIFFTRQLQNGVQDDSGWTRRAGREWKRRAEIYRRYVAAITPMLPPAVVRLCRETLHDAVVESIEQDSGTLTLVMDARGALGGVPWPACAARILWCEATSRNQRFRWPLVALSGAASFQSRTLFIARIVSPRRDGD